jgi:hypothetical protein
MQRSRQTQEVLLIAERIHPLGGHPRQRANLA